MFKIIFSAFSAFSAFSHKYTCFPLDGNRKGDLVILGNLTHGIEAITVKSILLYNTEKKETFSMPFLEWNCIPWS